MLNVLLDIFLKPNDCNLYLNVPPWFVFQLWNINRPDVLEILLYATRTCSLMHTQVIKYTSPLIHSSC